MKRVLAVIGFFLAMLVVAELFDEKIAYLVALGLIVIWFLKGDGRIMLSSAITNFRGLIGI